MLEMLLSVFQYVSIICIYIMVLSIAVFFIRIPHVDDDHSNLKRGLFFVPVLFICAMSIVYTTSIFSSLGYSLETDRFMSSIKSSMTALPVFGLIVCAIPVIINVVSDLKTSSNAPEHRKLSAEVLFLMLLAIVFALFVIPFAGNLFYQFASSTLDGTFRPSLYRI